MLLRCLATYTNLSGQTTHSYNVDVYILLTWFELLLNCYNIIIFRMYVLTYDSREKYVKEKDVKNKDHQASHFSKQLKENLQRNKKFLIGFLPL